MPAGFPTRKYEPLIIGSRAHDVGEVGGGADWTPGPRSLAGMGVTCGSHPTAFPV